MVLFIQLYMVLYGTRYDIIWYYSHNIYINLDTNLDFFSPLQIHLDSILKQTKSNCSLSKSVMQRVLCFIQKPMWAAIYGTQEVVSLA